MKPRATAVSLPNMVWTEVTLDDGSKVWVYQDAGTSVRLHIQRKRPQ